jgi:hypothetical protein
MRKWTLALALAACSGGGKSARTDPEPAQPPAPQVSATPVDPFAVACGKLKTRCDATDVAACNEMLSSAFRSRAKCDETGRFGEYTKCATGCLPSVRCEDDPALNCAAGCGQIECDQGGNAE